MRSFAVDKLTLQVHNAKERDVEIKIDSKRDRGRERQTVGQLTGCFISQNSCRNSKPFVAILSLVTSDIYWRL